MINSMHCVIYRRLSSALRDGVKRRINDRAAYNEQFHLSSAAASFRDENEAKYPIESMSVENNLIRNTSTDHVVEDVQSVAFNGRLLRKQNTARHRSEVDLTRDSDLTAIGGRLVRNTRGSEHRKIDSSGSVVATLSATATHRQNRMNTNNISVKNPSILSIPVSEESKSKIHATNYNHNEDVELRDNQHELKLFRNGMIGVVVGGYLTNMVLSNNIFPVV